MTDDLPANLSGDDASPDSGSENDGGASGSETSALSERDAASPLPFSDLVAPQPLASAPPTPARWLAFVGILVGGLLGGLIGYGTTDLLTGSEVWSAVGALVAGVGGAIGVGIVSSLTLRAMNEWRAVSHPEANSPKTDSQRTEGKAT